MGKCPDHRSGHITIIALIVQYCYICHILVLLLGYLRLGCMARDREQIYEASDWFKEALQINQVP